MPEKEFISKPKEEVKEMKERGPEMRLKFFFSPHFKKEDFAKLRKEIEDSDVYVPESFEHTSEIAERHKKLSQGELSPEKIARQIKEETFGLVKVSEAEEKLWEAIYNSKKPIYFVDIPEGHELVVKADKAREYSDLAFASFLTGKFTEAVDNKKKYIELFTKLQEERENYIKKNIEQLKPRILKDHPEFKNKKEIKILVSMGAAHTSLYHRFKKEKQIFAQRAFASLPIIFGSSAEFQRRKQFFSEQAVDKEKLIRSLMEDVFLFSLKEDKNIKTSGELVKITKYLVSKFKEKDIKNFSKVLGEKYLPRIAPSLSFAPISEPKWKELFEPPLKEFGVKLPETRKEVEEIIKKAEKRK